MWLTLDTLGKKLDIGIFVLLFTGRNGLFTLCVF